MEDLHPDLAALPGQTLDGRYRVDSLLGRGGMGAVFKGHHLGLRRDVAIKVLRPEIGNSSASSRQRFEREAQSVSRLDHENCVRVTDYGTTEGGLEYLVMELLEGRELDDALGEPWAPARAVEVCRQILAGLEHAHHFGIVHRDLKPENVFLTEDFRGREIVKLVDFGIAKLLDAEDGEGGGAQAKLTRTGMVFGTPRYMSPEQASGGKVDERTDLYAVGLILYELLTGRPPFVADEVAILLRMHILADPPELPPAVPPGLAAVVLELLAKSRMERFASAREVIAALEAQKPALAKAAPAAASSAPVHSGPVATPSMATSAEALTGGQPAPTSGGAVLPNTPVPPAAAVPGAPPPAAAPPSANMPGVASPAGPNPGAPLAPPPPPGPHAAPAPPPPAAPGPAGQPGAPPPPLESRGMMLGAAPPPARPAGLPSLPPSSGPQAAAPPVDPAPANPIGPLVSHPNPPTSSPGSGPQGCGPGNSDPNAATVGTPAMPATHAVATQQTAAVAPARPRRPWLPWAIGGGGLLLALMAFGAGQAIKEAEHSDGGGSLAAAEDGGPGAGPLVDAQDAKSEPPRFDDDCRDGECSCYGVASCPLTCPGECEVACVDSERCDLSVGDDSEVRCKNSERCEVECRGDCEVECIASKCKVECPHPSGKRHKKGKKAKKCDDGRRYVCGDDCD